MMDAWPIVDAYQMLVFYAISTSAKDILLRMFLIISRHIGKYDLLGKAVGIHHQIWYLLVKVL